jgi:hypothetical protein
VALWLLFSMATVAIVVAIAAKLLSATLILDLVALWPAAAVGAVIVPVAILRGDLWRFAPPLVFLLWVLAGLTLHLTELALLPSAAGDLDVGLGVDEVGTAELTAGPIDSLQVDFSGGAELVSITMRRRGGDVAPPTATKLVGDGRAEIVLSERDDPGFFEFEGWQLHLGDVGTWDLVLAAADLSIDTSGVGQASIQASGAGHVALSVVANESLLEVTGVFEVTVPRGVGVVLDGQATTPNDWTRTERGLTAPGDVAWTLIVSGDSRVTVSYQDP